jgi:hypothetical protein
VLVNRGELLLPPDFDQIAFERWGTKAPKIFHQMARQGEEELETLVRLSGENHAKRHGAK